ncbi:MAG TPA: N-acetylmuramoyl-L-alanine amidase [Azospirillaceae bacterium]|nr:N-acetylmuramoyl-L-alanine amidase [Azospirillaceae bacterium]
MNRRIMLRTALGLTIAVSGLGLWPDKADAAEARPAKGKALPLKPPFSPSPPRHKPRPPRLVMIDPGHGGHDPGAIGARGTYEKDVALDLAIQVARFLGQRAGVTAQLTRTRDVFLPLAERVGRARAARADFFLSIHADSAPNREARGLSAYTVAEKASDDFASALAKRENLADGPSGLNLKDTDKQVAAILVDLAARHTLNAARMAQAGLVQGVGRDLRLLDNPVRSANFAVLKAPDIPSVLVETGFLSNKEDEALLRHPASRRDIARVLAREMGALLTSTPFA